MWNVAISSTTLIAVQKYLAKNVLQCGAAAYFAKWILNVTKVSLNPTCINRNVMNEQKFGWKVEQPTGRKIDEFHSLKITLN